MVELTEEQQDFLKECEEEFKHRYTSDDEDFLKVKQAEPKPPPIEDPWFGNSNRPNRYQDRRNRQHYGHDRNDYRERDRYRDGYGYRDGERFRDDRHAGRHHRQHANYRPY